MPHAPAGLRPAEMRGETKDSNHLKFAFSPRCEDLVELGILQELGESR